MSLAHPHSEGWEETVLWNDGLPGEAVPCPLLPKHTGVATCFSVTDRLHVRSFAPRPVVQACVRFRPIISLCLRVFWWRQPTLSKWLAMSRAYLLEQDCSCIIFSFFFFSMTEWQAPVDLFLSKSTHFSKNATELQSLGVSQGVPTPFPSSEKDSSRCFLTAKSHFLQP